MVVLFYNCEIFHEIKTNLLPKNYFNLKFFETGETNIRYLTPDVNQMQLYDKNMKCETFFSSLFEINLNGVLKTFFTQIYNLKKSGIAFYSLFIFKLIITWCAIDGAGSLYF